MLFVRQTIAGVRFYLEIFREQDAGRVARWLGNSAGILLTHYAELVCENACRIFWGILGGA